MVNKAEIGDSFGNRVLTDLAKVKFKDFLVIIFLLFLPFSQALTINVVFPLKISEIFLFLILFYEISVRNILKWRMGGPVMLILIFLVVVFISVVFNFFYRYSYELPTEYSRITPQIDSLLKFIYVIISVVTLVITRNALSENPRLIKWFFVGAVISSCYAWYLFFSGMLHLPVLLLPGMDNPPQIMNTGMGDIIRCGTFKEGNYMGFFLLIAAFTALYYKRKILAIFFFLTIVTTFSTTSIFCAIVFYIFYLFKRFKKYKVKVMGAISIIAVIILLLNQFSESFNTIFYNKVFGDKDSVENANDLYSKADRLNTSYVGLQIFAHNPVLGVGLANYGLHYNHYNELPQLDVVDQAKRIPNNIYVEILSECGGIVFLIFLIFLHQLFRIAKNKSNAVLASGLTACCVYFLAFPTFTMLFIWFFLGVILS
ncbi:MAG TPA: O-antigen ligase family protein [Mucilaginibacter sp.]|nr:O-antigen ligase family protein [Mucilaginibacter sp.]